MKEKNISPRTVIVKVTHACNLNCRYCCLGDIVDHKIISETTIDNLFKKLVEESNESIIIWHGGEPLIVGLAFYKKIVELQSKYQNHKFQNSLQTNGTLLTDEYLDFFYANHFSLGFSIDGCEASHKLNRPFKGNKSSFEQTFKWYKKAEEKGMHPGAICVLNINTAKYIKEIYSFAKEYKVAFKFNPQYPAGRASTNKDLGLNNDQLAESYIKLFDLWFDDALEVRAPINMFEHFVESIKKITNGINGLYGYDCAWANRCQKSFVGIAPNGDIYPCGKFVDESDFLYGNINDNGSLKDILNNAIRQKFLTRHNEGIEECKSCRYLSMCSSGCPHTSYLFTNEIFSKNPFCQSNLKLFKHIENRLVEQNKCEDVYIEPLEEKNTNKYLVYSPLRGKYFVVGADAKSELENYLFNGVDLSNKTLRKHMQEWKNQIPINVNHDKIDTYNRCVILLTQQCNLQCGYCYAKEARSNIKLSTENVRIIVDRILSNHFRSQKLFSFIGGGEPTIDWDLLTWSIEYIRQHQKHDNVLISVTTNGTLLNEERIIWLKEHKVDIGLSFDILPEIQNKNRPFKDGQGSFEKINQTIRLLHEHDLYFRIRATISDEAVGLMPQMIKFIRDNYPFISHVQLEPIQDKQQNTSLYYDKFIKNFIEAYEIGSRSGIEVYNMITQSIATTKMQFCRGEFCLTPDGSIVGCQRYSSKRDRLFSKFKYGGISDGQVCIDDDSYRLVNNLFSEKLPQCVTCFAKYHCAGMCTAVCSDLSQDQLLEHCRFSKQLIKQMLLIEKKY